MQKISYAQAGTDALIEEMQRDATTFHLATSAPDDTEAIRLLELYGMPFIRQE